MTYTTFVKNPFHATKRIIQIYESESILECYQLAKDSTNNPNNTVWIEDENGETFWNNNFNYLTTENVYYRLELLRKLTKATQWRDESQCTFMVYTDYGMYKFFKSDKPIYNFGDSVEHSDFSVYINSKGQATRGDLPFETLALYMLDLCREKFVIV